MAPPRYHFDEHGNYLGYLDDEGRYRDTAGTDLGYVVRDRSVYDQQGACRGHVDLIGRYFDEHGTYLGYFRDPFRFARPSPEDRRPLRARRLVHPPRRAGAPSMSR
jgi:hypothetical protein